uniref:Uncharacterized protein n=1 Tax=Oryza glumipatula TaxID=40148 RepID=A0A0E0B3W2_9ORYZ
MAGPFPLNGRAEPPRSHRRKLRNRDGPAAQKRGTVYGGQRDRTAPIQSRGSKWKHRRGPTVPLRETDSVNSNIASLYKSIGLNTVLHLHIQISGENISRVG